MQKILECVPNFSEGQSKEVIQKIAENIQSVQNVQLLDIDSGFHAHRTVFTFIGEPEAVTNAAFEAIKCASQFIDMSVHKGTHPRIGATDVCPLIPYKNMEMSEAIALSKKLAERVAVELKIPSYLYNQSAQTEERKKLAWIRKGEYEFLAQKITQNDFIPDFGEPLFNSKSGICIIGARKLLLAYNINIETKNVEIAKEIASKIRETAPYGLPSVRAIGWYIKEFDKVQVSCNITDFEQTSIYEVFEIICSHATRLGTNVTGSELVGMIPLAALTNSKYNLENIDKAIEYLGLNDVKAFDKNQKIIELKLK